MPTDVLEEIGVGHISPSRAMVCNWDYGHGFRDGVVDCGRPDAVCQGWNRSRFETEGPGGGRAKSRGQLRGDPPGVAAGVFYAAAEVGVAGLVNGFLDGGAAGGE